MAGHGPYDGMPFSCSALRALNWKKKEKGRVSCKEGLWGAQCFAALPKKKE
jgi:hypothetical protein